MQKPHKEILTKEQIKLLPLLKKFSKNFGLVGGTAIAFQIGHRRSIDFDLFSLKPFENARIREKIQTARKIDRIIRDEDGQFTFLIGAVRFTFFHYPFPIKFDKRLDNIITMPNLLILAAMKSYALGRRAKWKDYIDLYFIMKYFHGINEIVKKGGEIFAGEFNEKIFREQLSYFKDIDYSEEIMYLKGFKADDKIVKKELTELSTSI